MNNMQRITQTQLDNAIKRLAKEAGINLTPYNAYGYYQLGFSRDNGCMSVIYATQGDSKKELYYQIDFCLSVLNEMRNNIK